MRILISFLLLMTSFLFAETCEETRNKSIANANKVNEEGTSYPGYSVNMKSNAASDRLCRNGTYSGCTNASAEIKKDKIIYKYELWSAGNIVDTVISSQPLIVCDDNPTLPEPKKCNQSYCSSADKQRFESAIWYETGTGCSMQNVKWKNVSGGSELSYDFSCENPRLSSGLICVRYYDEPIDCEETNSEEESPALPDDIDIPDIDKVPCFGNVEGCNSTTLPDYIDPNTGVPCWGKECNNVKPPDSVGPDGIPCWGDKCGISPPKDKDGNNGGNDNGTGNGNGNGAGNGNGTGEGEGDGKGEGWGDCPAGGCPDNSALINGQGFAKIPDTFHETKYRDKAIEEALDNYIKESPFDFNKIDTDLGVRGSCPVNWSVPFLHGTSINFGVPCSVFDQLRTFFVFLSYLLSFYIVFRKRS